MDTKTHRIALCRSALARNASSTLTVASSLSALTPSSARVNDAAFREREAWKRRKHVTRGGSEVFERHLSVTNPMMFYYLAR